MYVHDDLVKILKRQLMVTAPIKHCTTYAALRVMYQETCIHYFSKITDTEQIIIAFLTCYYVYERTACGCTISPLWALFPSAFYVLVHSQSRIIWYLTISCITTLFKRSLCTSVCSPFSYGITSGCVYRTSSVRTHHSQCIWHTWQAAKILQQAMVIARLCECDVSADGVVVT